MAGSSFIRSIRFRLVFIVVIITAAFLFQNSFLTSSDQIINDFDDIGSEYKDRDARLTQNLKFLSDIVDLIEQDHVTTFISEAMFSSQFNEDAKFNTMNRYTSLVSQIQKDINDRDDSLYKVDSSALNGFYDIFFGLNDESIGKQSSNDRILSKSDRNIKSQFSELIIRSIDENGSKIQDYIEESNNARLTHELLLSEVYSVTGLESEIGVVPRMLGAITFLMNKIGESSILDKAQAVTLVHNTSTQIATVISEISLFESLTLKSNISQDERVSNTKIFKNMLVQSKKDISPLQDDLKLLSLTTEMRRSVDEIFQYFNLITDLLINSVQVISINIPDFIALMRERLPSIIENLQIEVGKFNQRFDNVIDDLKNNVNSWILILSIVIPLLLFFITGITTVELVRYFNRSEKNYKQITTGDFTIPSKDKYSPNEIGTMDEGFDNMISEIRRILDALQRSSERMAGIAEELAAGAQEASASVQEVSNTVREFSSGASEQNLMLSRIDEKLSQHLRDIQEAVSRIQDTSTFVLKVAKRTNILGLNASIEAAKAGRFGLGFNVVAEEVRHLSEDTKTSAIEIAELIESIEYRIEQSVREMLKDVNITKDVAENTAAGSEEASAATSEQVTMLSEISQTSNELSLLANELQELLHRFTLSK